MDSQVHFHLEQQTCDPLEGMVVVSGTLWMLLLCVPTAAITSTGTACSRCSNVISSPLFIILSKLSLELIIFGFMLVPVANVSVENDIVVCCLFIGLVFGLWSSS